MLRLTRFLRILSWKIMEPPARSSNSAMSWRERSRPRIHYFNNYLDKEGLRVLTQVPEDVEGVSCRPVDPLGVRAQNN